MPTTRGGHNSQPYFAHAHQTSSDVDSSFPNSSDSQTQSSDGIHIDPDLELTPKPRKFPKALENARTPKKRVNYNDSEDNADNNADTPVPYKSKRNKPSTHLILGSEYFKPGKYKPTPIPDDYEPVSNKTEDPELIRRAPDPDDLSWGKLDTLSEAEQLAVRMGCCPEDHREIYSRRNYIYTKAFTSGVDLRVPWKTVSTEKKRSLLRAVYRKAQAKYGFDKDLVEGVMKSICKNNVKNDNSRKKAVRYNPKQEPLDDGEDTPTTPPPSKRLGTPSNINPRTHLGNPPTVKQTRDTKPKKGIYDVPNCRLELINKSR